jgi:Fe-S oxidoreductase
MLPYSRYMHIPTEVLLIFLRNFGIKASEKSPGFAETEIHACSRCGVCIDACQLSSAAGINNIQPVYFVQSIRDKQALPAIADRCLVCGRCQDACPVGVSTDYHRVSQRETFRKGEKINHGYFPSNGSKKAEVVYFSGCMGHLTPSVIRAMKGIFGTAGVDYIHLDEKEGVCCGRPMMLSGKEEQALLMISKNKEDILLSGAEVLVTSCPICLRVFKEKYDLRIRVLHHSQYILELLKKGKIPVQSVFPKVVYHDPCDLGRGLNIYQEPRELIHKVADLVPLQHENNDALCCGGSLGIFNIKPEERKKITGTMVDVLQKDDPDAIITSCPLCKKTIAGAAGCRVMDIAELVHESIPEQRTTSREKVTFALNN